MAKTVNFEVATYNLHVNTVKKRPEALIRDIGHLFKTAHVVVVQEGGQAQNVIRKACVRYGLKVFKGYGQPGQDSTPILYKKGLKVKNFKSVKLTDRERVNPKAAGPTYTKPKWLNGVLFKFGGRFIWVTNIHTTPSVQFKENERVVRKQIRNADAALEKLRGIKIIGGDFNTLPNHSVRNPLEDKMRSVQIVGGRINTKGGRNIDDIYFTKDPTRIRLEHSYEFNGASDHDALVAVFKIVKRPLLERNR